MEKQIEWTEAARKGMRKMKQHLKDMALKIRKTRNDFKEKQRKHEDTYKDMRSLWVLCRDYRHCHIAYSELRGKERHQIEVPADWNLPNEDTIMMIKNRIFEGMK